MQKIKPALWIILTLVLIACNKKSESQTDNNPMQLDTIVIAKDFHVPWEILWGPDDHIWMTERSGRVSRINPDTKTVQRLLEISVIERGESGLLGMALHPHFPDEPFVYLVYNYPEGNNIRERLVRYTYQQDQLVNEEILINNISGNTYHDGSRLVFGPDDKLYMTTGDAGDMPLSQDLSSLSGKILRINPDGSVPDDNPIEGSYVWALGLRNTQGLDYARNGILYSSEHGPDSDDEINILEQGRNYGWPTVKGPCDTQEEMQFCTANNVMEPIQHYTPTLAVAGIAYYGHQAIPEWSNSLIVTSLKAGRLLVLHLSDAGDSIVSSTTVYDNEFGRLRDVCVSDDGRVFISTSNNDGRGSPNPGDDMIIEIVASSPTAIGEKVKPTSFNIYPNPSRHQVKADIDSRLINGTFEVYDMEGRSKLKGNTKQLATGIDISSLAAGLYNVVIRSKNEFLTSTLLVL